MKRLALLSCLVALSVGVAPLAASPQDDFDKLYGADAKKVSPRDAATLAEKILGDVEKLADEPATSAYFVNRATEIWQKAPNTHTEKARVGEMLLTNLLAVADALYTDKKYTEASKAYQQAWTVGTAIKSKRIEEFANRKNIAQLRADAYKKLLELKKDLEDKNKAASAAREIVLLLVVELDEPKDAAACADKLTDQTVKEMTALAAKDVTELGGDKAKDLAEWYRAQAGLSSTSLAGKATAYPRAKAAYERFIAQHEKQDMAMLTATKAMEEVNAEIEKLGLPAAKVVSGPEDSMGTWMVVMNNAPSSKTYLSFHKEGKVSIASFSPDFGTEYNKNSPITKVTINDDGKWESIEKGKKVQLSNFWTLPLPLTPGKITIDFGHNWKTEATLTKVPRGQPQTELAKLTAGKSTKITGKWDVGGMKTEFHDDGTGTMSGLNMGQNMVMLMKWKIDRGTLVFSSGAWDNYTFPYPLGKGETKGKRVYTFRGRPSGGGDATIKPWKDQK